MCREAVFFVEYSGGNIEILRNTHYAVSGNIGHCTAITKLYTGWYNIVIHGVKVMIYDWLPGLYYCEIRLVSNSILSALILCQSVCPKFYRKYQTIANYSSEP